MIGKKATRLHDGERKRPLKHRSNSERKLSISFVDVSNIQRIISKAGG